MILRSLSLAMSTLRQARSRCTMLKLARYSYIGVRREGGEGEGEGEREKEINGKGKRRRNFNIHTAMLSNTHTSDVV